MDEKFDAMCVWCGRTYEEQKSLVEEAERALVRMEAHRRVPIEKWAEDLARDLCRFVD